MKHVIMLHHHHHHHHYHYHYHYWKPLTPASTVCLFPFTQVSFLVPSFQLTVHSLHGSASLATRPAALPSHHQREAPPLRLSPSGATFHISHVTNLTNLSHHSHGRHHYSPYEPASPIHLKLYTHSHTPPRSQTPWLRGAVLNPRRAPCLETSAAIMRVQQRSRREVRAEL